MPAWFEGGQMPLHRRLPKRGFHNLFRVVHPIVNLGRLQVAIDGKKIDPAKPINAEVLFTAGLLRRADSGVRILAKGKLSAKVRLEVGSASASAIAAVKKAGGEIVLPAAPAPVPAKAAKAKKKDAKAASGDAAAKKGNE